jgi:outer membrane usher protein
VLRHPDGRVLLRAEDLRRLRVRVPEDADTVHGNEKFIALNRFAGLAYRVDEATQTLIVEAPAAVFEATTLSGQTNAFIVPPPPAPGAFANYDVFANHADDRTVTSGTVELGIFNRFGVGTSSFVGRSTGPGDHFVRLDTTWTHDRPADLASLRLGDAITGTGTWGRAVRFGGVQWATNFATQPGLITFPLPALAGEAVLPSVVDLYVNDALRLRREVPGGPFSIQDLPVVTGRGEMRLVVRDILGRERVVVQPFYASARLLHRGLQEYSYEVGAVRENYGLESNEYGRAVGVATHRYGFNDHFTGEAHAEALRGQQTAGLGAAFLWSDVGVFHGAIAGSRHDRRGRGSLASFGFERSSQRASFGGSTQWASADFVQLGMQPNETAPKQVSRVFMSVATTSMGSFGLGYTHQDFRDREDVELVNATYSLSLGQWGFVSLSALHFLGGDGKTIFALNYTRPLDERTSVAAGYTGERGSHQGQVQLQRNLPPGTGVGYRVLAAAGDIDRLEAGVSAQNDYGTYTLEAGRARGETAYRAGATGGVAFIGGNVYLSRRIDDSFAVAHVPGYADVRLFLANQPVARTRADGTALIPRLLPYQKNRLRVEQADLPLDTQIESVEVEAVPWFRSGMLVPFPVKRSRGATLTIRLENGDALPAGALVRVGDAVEEHPVGLRGEVYVTGLSERNRLRASWRGRSCELDVPFPATSDPLPDLGTYVCKGVTR